MIDINTETLLTPDEARRQIPGRKGKQLDLCTLYRWMQRGRKGVRLEYACLSRKQYTSKEALARFSSASPRPPKNLASASLLVYCFLDRQTYSDVHPFGRTASSGTAYKDPTACLCGRVLRRASRASEGFRCQYRSSANLLGLVVVVLPLQR